MYGWYSVRNPNVALNVGGLSINTVKTFILMLVLTSLLLLTGFLWTGDPSGVILFLFIALGLNFFTFWSSDRMVLRLSNARLVSPEEAVELHAIVDEQVSRAGIPKPKVFIMESDSPNAFATGRSKNHASIAVTTGIQKILNRDELGGVIAHELAHVGNRDTLVMTIVAAMAMAIGLIAMIARFSMFFGGFGGRQRGGNPAVGLIGLLVIAVVMPMVATIVRLAISRSREYQADRTGAITSGKPLSLASALAKLHEGSQREPMKMSQERLEPISFLFIANPLRGGGMARLFSSHPPMRERISRLEAMERERI